MPYLHGVVALSKSNVSVTAKAQTPINANRLIIMDW